MEYNFLREAEEWFSDIAVNPHELKERDKISYSGLDNWRVVQVIDFNCEKCDLNHKAVVVAYRNHQFQTWEINDTDDNKYFWLTVVPLKHKKEFKKRFRRLHELNMKAYKDKKK